MNLPWTEKVPMLSINPESATPEDVARLAAELMECRHALGHADTMLRAVDAATDIDTARRRAQKGLAALATLKP